MRPKRRQSYPPRRRKAFPCRILPIQEPEQTPDEQTAVPDAAEKPLPVQTATVPAKVNPNPKHRIRRRRTSPKRPPPKRRFFYSGSGRGRI